MPQEIEQYLEKYPEEIVMLFLKIRDVIFLIDGIIIEEKMWAKIPSYYYGERFVRIIPFKDHHVFDTIFIYVRLGEKQIRTCV